MLVVPTVFMMNDCSPPGARSPVVMNSGSDAVAVTKSLSTR